MVLFSQRISQQQTAVVNSFTDTYISNNKVLA